MSPETEENEGMGTTELYPSEQDYDQLPPDPMTREDPVSPRTDPYIEAIEDVVHAVIEEQGLDLGWMRAGLLAETVAVRVASRWPVRLAASPADGAGVDVERLGFTDLLDIGEELLLRYPPDTIVCSHSVKADIGAQTAAGIADVIASCRAALEGASDGKERR